jgi:ferredoxin--NADP+ reductase
LLDSGKLCEDLGLPPLSVTDDRFMLCGSPAMLSDLCSLLDGRGFREYGGGELGHYVIERAFVER